MAAFLVIRSAVVVSMAVVVDIVDVRYQTSKSLNSGGWEGIIKDISKFSDSNFQNVQVKVNS